MFGQVAVVTSRVQFIRKS